MVLPFAIGAVVLGVSWDFQTPLFGQIWPVDAVIEITSVLACRRDRARDSAATTAARGEDALVTNVPVGATGTSSPDNLAVYHQ